MGDYWVLIGGLYWTGVLLRLSAYRHGGPAAAVVRDYWAYFPDGSRRNLRCLCDVHPHQTTEFVFTPLANMRNLCRDAWRILNTAP